jgi:hypothetical protein
MSGPKPKAKDSEIKQVARLHRINASKVNVSSARAERRIDWGSNAARRISSAAKPASQTARNGGKPGAARRRKLPASRPR